MTDQAITAMPAGAVPPTRNALDLLRVVVEWMDTFGHAPTYAELMRELELGSKGTVKRLLDQLEERRWIERLPCRARAIRVLHRPPLPDFGPPRFVLSAELAERVGQ